MNGIRQWPGFSSRPRNTVLAPIAPPTAFRTSRSPIARPISVKTCSQMAMGRISGDGVGGREVSWSRSSNWRVRRTVGLWPSGCSRRRSSPASELDRRSSVARRHHQSSCLEKRRAISRQPSNLHWAISTKSRPCFYVLIIHPCMIKALWAVRALKTSSGS